MELRQTSIGEGKDCVKLESAGFELTRQGVVGGGGGVVVGGGWGGVGGWGVGGVGGGWVLTITAQMKLYQRLRTR